MNDTPIETGCLKRQNLAVEVLLPDNVNICQSAVKIRCISILRSDHRFSESRFLTINHRGSDLGRSVTTCESQSSVGLYMKVSDDVMHQ